MAQTVGSNLTVDRSPEARALSLALDKYIRKLNTLESKTQYHGDPACRVFIKVATGAVATNTSADSPGGDCCFVANTYDKDLFFVSGWSLAGTFVSTKILD